MNVKYYNHLAQRMLDKKNKEEYMYYELSDGKIMNPKEYEKYLENLYADSPNNSDEFCTWLFEKTKKEPISD